MSTHRSAPYARMIENKFDVSAYCQDSLVTSFDHLTSIKFALFSLIRPALKIATRSFFIERQDLTFSRILSQLNDETPITPTQNESTNSENNRTFFQRLVYFLIVGIPLALLVGILAGLIHFVKTVFNDILNIISILKKFYIMSRADIRFYSENPDSLPTREAAVDGVVNSGLKFYTRQLVDRKLGFFSFLARPLVALLAFILTKQILKLLDRFDRLQTRRKARRNPNSTATNQDHFKFD